MPETAMDKYDCIIFWENKVWFARKRFIMKFKSETVSGKEFPDDNFRLCVFSPDHGHIITSGFFIVDICHEF